MAIFHFHVEQVRRSNGSSAVAKAAYRAGEKLYSERYDETNDYRNKRGVIENGILLPSNAPPEYSDRQTLWNAVEKAEKRSDAQLAYSFDIALQNEFSPEENSELIRKFIKENFVARGMIADYAIHRPDPQPGGIPNPHVHVMAPIRPLKEDGTWGNKQRSVPVLDENGNRIRDEKHNRWKTTSVPSTDWGSPETLEEWRKNWCDLCNGKFHEKGMDERIDWRSYERQGSELLAQVHEGYAVRALEKRGVRTDKGEYNRFVKSMNALLKSVRRNINALLKWIEELTTEQKTHREKEPTLPEVMEKYIKDNYFRSGMDSQQMEEIYKASGYLRQRNITTSDQLEERIREIRSECSRIGGIMSRAEKTCSRLEKAIVQGQAYKRTLPVYEEYRKPAYRFKQAGEKFYSEHRDELNDFYEARRYLNEFCRPGEYTPDQLDEWVKEYNEAADRYNSQLIPLKNAQDEEEILNFIRRCMDQVLGRTGKKEEDREVPEEPEQKGPVL